MKFETYPEQIKIRLSKEENEFIKEKSKQLNIGQASYIRMMIDYFMTCERISKNED